MKIRPATVNVMKSLVISGVKYVGNYIYVLLLDAKDLCLIKRIKTDDSEIKYHQIEEEGETIEQFFANPETHTSYVWFNQL